MVFSLALVAALGCAIFNGIAAILEKIGAGREEKFIASQPGLLWKLRGNLPYVLGIVLDLMAWILTLFAVHTLPLFVVQPIIACSVIVTVLIEHFLFRRRSLVRIIIPITAIVFGLVLLASVSSEQRSVGTSPHARLVILLMPLVLALIGWFFSTKQKRYATMILAATSGLAFGGISIAGRAIAISQPYYHALYNPLAWVIVAYGLLGILFFTIALQRASAAAVNATMISFETLFPIVIGLVFLGDHPKNELWFVMTLGILFTFIGTTIIALSPENK